MTLPRRPTVRCDRPCHKHPPRWREHRHSDRGQINVYPTSQLPRVFGIGAVVVILGLIVSQALSGAPEPTCGTAPSFAYRSGGAWYVGDVVVGTVDPYNPDCYPSP